MIEITDGFTSISAGPDGAGTRRIPTGARVTLEFRRETALPPAQLVRVCYDFAGDGNLREGMGFATPIRTLVRPGHAVVYYYRLSYWIAPSALMRFLTRARRPHEAASPATPETVAMGPAVDRSRA